MRYQVVFRGQEQRNEDGRQQMVADRLEAHLDRVTEQLLALGAADATVSAALTVGEVEISMTVEADGFEEALHVADDLIRQALRRAGGGADRLSIDWCSATATRTESHAGALQPSA